MILVLHNSQKKMTKRLFEVVILNENKKYNVMIINTVR